MAGVLEEIAGYLRREGPGSLEELARGVPGNRSTLARTVSELLRGGLENG